MLLDTHPSLIGPEISSALFHPGVHTDVSRLEPLKSSPNTWLIGPAAAAKVKHVK